MIEVKNVEKSFGDSKVLKGISTVFETGKTNLIIGQSGSGKTGSFFIRPDAVFPALFPVLRNLLRPFPAPEYDNSR